MAQTFGTFSHLLLFLNRSFSHTFVVVLLWPLLQQTQVFSPPRDNQYGNAFFPGIIDMLKLAQTDSEAWTDVQHEIWRVARAFERVAMILNGSLL